MTPTELKALLANLRRLGGEPDRVEVKRAAGGLPKSVAETMSAFANTAGGVIILGVDEAHGFATVKLPDAMKLRDQLAQMSRDKLTPALQITTEILDIEGRLIVVAEVPAVRPDQKPVYVTARGIATGSFLRSGDGDRQLTQTEIAMFMAARTQASYDREPVPNSSTADLNPEMVLRFVQRVRSASPQLRNATIEQLYYRLGITSAPGKDATLTLAGLLTFGDFPQYWFPQLMVSVVVHPESENSEVRFVDNVAARGSIPEIIETCLGVIRRNLKVAAVIMDSGSRQDRIELPIESVREIIVNAILHRDYSPATRGTQIQVELYPDRLVVRNPGGLYGGISISELGESQISTSRNAMLASILADTYLPNSADIVAENRASGIVELLKNARDFGLAPPVFTASITSFEVSLGRIPLLNSSTRAWLDALPWSAPSPNHELALAMLKSARLTVHRLQQWGVERVAAQQILRDLRQAGLVIEDVLRRPAEYVLAPDFEPTQAPTGPPAETQPLARSVKSGAPHPGFEPTKPRPNQSDPAQIVIAELLQQETELTAAELTHRTGYSRATINSHLKLLAAAGKVESLGVARSPKRTYRWVQK